MRVSVIVPVHNGSETLERCLAALARATRPPDEVIVVDDASTDGICALAERYGAHYLPLDGPAHGPAFARNRGAEVAQGDVLFFVDADVAVHDDAVAVVVEELTARPDVAACFGSYDDSPSAPGLVSQYRNLLHHYVHQHAREEASTFWAGCGAVRREAFAAVGGFPESYARPSIEDIEMGTRLRAQGYSVRLLKHLQCTHMKHWRLGRMILTDIRDRAVPWTRVALRHERLPNDLNLTNNARWNGLCAVGLLAALLAGFWKPAFWLAAPPLAAVLYGLNSDFYRYYARLRGPAQACGAAVLHWLYYVYSSVTFGLVVGSQWLRRHGLAVLLLATFAKNLAGALLMTPITGPDERYHFQYAQALERFGAVNRAPQDYIPKELDQLWELVQRNRRLLRADWSVQQRRTITGMLAQANSVSSRVVYIDGHGSGLRLRNFAEYHPPLYHVIAGGVQWLLEGHGLTARALGTRLISVLLGCLTVWLIHQAALLLWPGNAWFALATATMAAFHRRFTMFSSIISNITLEITLFALLLYLCLLILRRGNQPRLLVALGVTVTAGLLTRASFAVTVPLVALLFCWQACRVVRRRGSVRELLPWVWVGLLPLAGAWWWYRDAVFSGGETMLSLYGETESTAQVTLAGFLARTQWLGRYRSLLLNYWGPTPQGVTRAQCYTSLATTLVVLVWSARRVLRHPGGPGADTLVAVALLGLATLAVDAFWVYLEFRFQRDMGGPYATRPAYYLAPFAGQMLWYGLGWALLAPRMGRLLARLTASVALVVQAWLCVSEVITGGLGGGLLKGLERAAFLQPGPSWMLVAVFAGYLLLGVVLLATIWSVNGEPPVALGGAAEAAQAN
ncbi:MAG: glycosyltransferase, partial [Chloroflexi bacterium]|nr:glycosyltransferase [Chloroflexota bacterium]